MDYAVRRVQRTDAMFVQEPSSGYARRVLALDITLFVTVLICWTLYSQLHGWWLILAAVIIGLQLGRAGIVAWRRASAYRAGWLRGRSQMVYAMVEAQRRGMTPQQWLAGELARDYDVLGITEGDLEKYRPTEE